MGRTACTEPQCMYKGALYLFFTLSVRVSQMNAIFNMTQLYYFTFNYLVFLDSVRKVIVSRPYNYSIPLCHS